MHARVRRPFRGLAALAALGLIAGTLLQAGPAAAADTTDPTTPKNLHVTSVSSTAVGLAWSAATDNVRVSAYLVLRNDTKIARVKAPTTSYTDTAVRPGKTYSYRVRARDRAGNRSRRSKLVTATTPSSSSSTVVVGAAGDIACDPADPNYHGGDGTSTACRMKYTSDLLVNGGYDAVFALGDEQYDSGSLSDFNTSYGPTWGRVKSISYPIVGNHEYGQSGASGYFDYFGSRAGDPSKGYYSFNLGDWHIVAVNSECDKIGGCDSGSPEETWLRNDLAAHPAKCTLAMWHHGRFSSGHDGDNTYMQAMWKDLVDANAEILLSGHSHDYERFAPQDENGNLDTADGVRQFIVGTGGAFFTGLGTSFDDNSQAAQNTTYGILKLTLKSDSYDWQFVPEAGKTYTDSGSTSCH